MKKNQDRTDADSTISQLKSEVQQFISDRDWEQFHDPKNVAMALASEVGELLDLFRWVRSEKSFQVLEDEEMRTAVRMELADITMFLVDLASICEIDLTESVSEKMKINASRYPVEKARGIAKKYTQLGETNQDPASD